MFFFISAIIKKLDDGVANIFESTYKRRLLDNIVIAFVSDNIGMTYGFKNNYVSNQPFRKPKVSQFLVA